MTIHSTNICFSRAHNYHGFPMLLAIFMGRNSLVSMPPVIELRVNELIIRDRSIQTKQNTFPLDGE